MDSQVSGGSIIAFDVDNFYNPYSGKPRSGFIVNTTDSVGGYIDSSATSKLTISFQVNDFTDFTSLDLYRVDS